MDIHKKRKIILDKLKYYPYSLKDFSHHEHVSFSWLDGEREGIIHAINEIDFYYGVCPSLDIWVENENALYKDIPIVNVKKIL